ncbi:MAG: hypothetical protein WA376_22670 [Terrimicrobiaceae bacterium]
MLNILRAGDSPSFQQGPFKTGRMRPGLVRSPVADPAFGPLSAVDRANLDVGEVVKKRRARHRPSFPICDLGTLAWRV